MFQVELNMRYTAGWFIFTLGYIRWLSWTSESTACCFSYFAQQRRRNAQIEEIFLLFFRASANRKRYHANLRRLTLLYAEFFSAYFSVAKSTLMQIFMLFACLLLHGQYSPIIAIICLCTCSLFTCFNIPGDLNRIFVDLPVSVWTLVILAYRSPGTARLRDQYENKDMVELALKTYFP